MQAVVINLRLNSLYSIRVPFTWQSALTYPILPPSAVIGMVANALQRYKNDKHPQRYLEELEEEIEWAGSRLMGPCVVKSYITSAITKWEDKLGGKFTNALGRQFAFARAIQVVAVFKYNVPEEIIKSLISVPLTCGDSESATSLENKPETKEAFKESLAEDRIVETPFPVPFELEGALGSGRLYLMHERCLYKGKNFPLISYLCPLKERNGVIEPSFLRIKCKKETNIIYIKDTGDVILRRS